jgi:Iap family predicted aminopeptidase
LAISIRIKLPEKIELGPRRYNLNDKTYTKSTVLVAEDIIQKLYGKSIEWKKEGFQSSVEHKGNSILFEFVVESDEERKNRFLSLYAMFQKSNIKITNIKTK